MTNHFRTLLLNMSYGGDPDEHIPQEFTARSLSGELLTIHSILFPANASRTKRLCLVTAYLELINGAGMSEVTTAVDSRVTYDLNTDFNFFGNKGIDITALYSQLSSMPDATSRLLNRKSSLDTSKYDNTWTKHPNKAYRVAGLIAALGLRLS